MFTGLVEHLGTVQEITTIDSSAGYEGFNMTIGNAAPVLSDCQLGDSIAVNGVCLTVTEWDAEAGWFKVGIANETLSRSDLGSLKVNDFVNLERAMSGHGRFGGHFVQGHVDTTATILSTKPDGDSIRILFSLPIQFFTALIPKGYIALDGTSLTLTELRIPKSDEEFYKPDIGIFGVMLVVHTQSRTVVAKKTIGEKVNVECDPVGKGVESIVRNVLEGKDSSLLEGVIERVVVKVLTERGIIS